MRTLVISAIVAAGAVSVYAASQQQTTTAEPKAAAAQQTTSAQQTGTVAPVTDTDSPLVRAAKHTGHPAKGKSKVVITNDTLAKSGGHLTTTKTQVALPPVPKADPALDKLAAEQKVQKAEADAAKAQAKKDADEKKKRAMERAAAIYEGDDPAGIFEDPGVAEHRMEEQAKQQNQQSGQKPPV